MLNQKTHTAGLVAQWSPAVPVQPLTLCEQKSIRRVPGKRFMNVTVSQGLRRHEKKINYSILAASFVGLYFTSKINYLLFHSLAEIFSIVVAFSLFVIAWNSRNFIKNQYLLFIGIAYLFIGFLDLLHTLSYKGMPVFPDYDFYANQLWIATRYMESISLLVAFFFLYSQKSISLYRVLAVFTALTALIVLSVFVWQNFPECFVEGQGLTAFKKNSEYIICTILIVNIVLLFKCRERFEPKVFGLLLWAFIFSIVAELAFTFYISNYGLSNLVGHYFKILSFLMVYFAIIKTGIDSPFSLIFRELDNTNKQLREEIEIRKKTEAELNTAIAEIKTLQGILPVCSYCKNIRDDQGSWSRIEAYISKHSDAQFSHGICPDCMKDHHPDAHRKLVQKGFYKA
jgi:hypothetical protein